MANELSGNALRFQFLETVYEATGGDPMVAVHLDLVCDQLGMDRESLELAMRWLKDARLLKYATHGPTLSVEHLGVRVVEDAREYPERAIPPFPAYNEMFPQVAQDPTNTTNKQKQEPVRQGSAEDLDSSETDRSDVSGEPVFASKLDEREPETRSASLSVDVLLQEQVAIPLRTNPDVRALDDKLGFTPYVDAIASFLLSSKTQPPLTLSIEGDWGVGKSSFMVQLRNRIELEAGRRNGATKPLWVEFNPWLHSKDEELWASFAVKFVRKVAGQLSWLERWTARTRLLLNRILRPEHKAGLLRGVAMLIGFIGAVLVGLVGIRYAGPGWIDVLASLAGPASDAVAKWLRVGGATAVVSAVVVLAAWSWPHIKRALSIDVRAYLSTPDYASRVPFVLRFHQDFDAILKTHVGRRRVFIFVDDVDRCTPPRAADLMRAINMLIPENKQVVFILGIDREKVAAGIAASYERLLPYLAADAQPRAKAVHSKEAAGLEFGRGFVEKFVQLPFAVPTPDRADLERYIRHLGESQGVEGIVELSRPTAEARKTQGQQQDEERFEAQIVHLDAEDSPKIQRTAVMVSGVLGRNPRRVKQFLNLLRLRVYIGHATHMFQDTRTSRSWSVPQLGKLIALELLEPTLLTSLDRDSGLLQRLEETAVFSASDSRAVSPDEDEGDWLTSRPRLKELLRLGCIDDEWNREFASGQCSFRGLDVSRALRTAPRVREFPVDRPEPRIVRKHLTANVSVSGSVQAVVKRVNVSDEGRGHDSVSVERFEAPQSDLASEEEGGETQQMKGQGIPITSSKGSTSLVRRVLPPTQRGDLWEIVALIPAEGKDFEEIVGSYATEERAVEVFSQFEEWNLSREQKPSSRVRPFQFPPS